MIQFNLRDLYFIFCVRHGAGADIGAGETKKMMNQKADIHTQIYRRQFLSCAGKRKEEFSALHR